MMWKLILFVLAGCHTTICVYDTGCLISPIHWIYELQFAVDFNGYSCHNSCFRFFRKEQNTKSGHRRTYMYVKSAINNVKTRGFVTVIVNKSGRDTEQW